MTQGVFEYSKAVWVHQMNQLGEATVEEVAHTVKTYCGASIVLQKAYDGREAMGRFDTVIVNGQTVSHPDSITNVQKFQTLVRRYSLAGVTMLPWVVPNTHTDAAVHALLAPYPIVIDLEPYSSFWMDDPARIADYIGALHAAGIDEVYVSIDPRKSAENALHVASWVGLTAGLLPQLYWTDFQQPESVIPALEQQLTTYNVPVYPVFPWNGSAVDMINAWASAVALGMNGCSLWRLGPGDEAQLGAFGALALPAPPLPTPIPVPGPIVRRAPTNDDFVAVERLMLGEATTGYVPDVAGAITYLQQFV